MNNLEGTYELMDTAISKALKESKSMYTSVSCNLPTIHHPTFSWEPVPSMLSPKVSNKMGLEVVFEASVEFLNKAEASDGGWAEPSCSQGMWCLRRIGKCSWPCSRVAKPVM